MKQRATFELPRPWLRGFVIVAGAAAAAPARLGRTAQTGKEYAVSEHIVTRADNGKELEIDVGERLVVRLEESPTTGFAWSPSGVNEKLGLLTSEYSPASPGSIGGGGLRTLTFTARQVGAVSLRLKLWREWEGDSSVVDVFAVKAMVREH
jgi:predicted secreted protein